MTEIKTNEIETGIENLPPKDAFMLQTLYHASSTLLKVTHCGIDTSITVVRLLFDKERQREILSGMVQYQYELRIITDSDMDILSDIIANKAYNSWFYYVDVGITLILGIGANAVTNLIAPTHLYEAGKPILAGALISASNFLPISPSGLFTRVPYVLIRSILLSTQLLYEKRFSRVHLLYFISLIGGSSFKAMYPLPPLVSLGTLEKEQLKLLTKLVTRQVYFKYVGRVIQWAKQYAICAIEELGRFPIDYHTIY